MDNDAVLQQILSNLNNLPKDLALGIAANDIVEHSKKMTNEYNKTGDVNEEDVCGLRDRVLGFCKSVIKRFCGDSPLGIFLKVKGEFDTAVTAYELLQALKPGSDAEAEEVIDLACKFIKIIASKYPIVGPIVGPLFGKAAKIYFTSVITEADILNDYLYAIDYYASLSEHQILPTSSQNEPTIETVQESNRITWTISGTTATGKIEGKQVAKITGLKKGTKASDLSDSGDVITIANSALTTVKVAITGDYKLALGDDVTESETTPAGFYIDGTTATYKTVSKTAGYSVAANGKSISYVKAVASKNLTTVSSLKSGVTANDLNLNKTNVTVSANALGTDTVNITGNYNLVLGNDVTKSMTAKASWEIDDTSAEYTTAHISEGYVLSKNKKSIIYNEESGGEMVATIDGLKKNTKANAFSVKNNVITVAKTALNSNNTIILDSEEYTLAIGAGAKKSVITDEGWHISGTTATYDTEKMAVGYAVLEDGKVIEYIPETDGGETLVKLTGLKKESKSISLSIDDNVVEISKNVIGTNMTATGEGYEFKLASAGKITAKSKNTTLTGSEENDTLIGSKYADVLNGCGGNDYLSGGFGRDSLYSTAGNNTLTGGTGKDTFIYSGGNAVITDYNANYDKISISGSYTSSINDKDVIFKTSAGNLTVKNGVNKRITVNNSTQKYSNVSEMWFAVEDNFATASDVSDITKSKIVAEFENYKSDYKQENFITYA